MSARRAAVVLAAGLLAAGCSGTALPAPDERGAPRAVDVGIPAQPGQGGSLEYATDLQFAGDGSWVVLVGDASESGVVRVRDGEVVSRSYLTADAAAALPRDDGSVAVLALREADPVLRVALVPPGGDADAVDPVATRPTDPPVPVLHPWDVSAVLAPDGEHLLALVEGSDGPPALVRIDPATGAVDGRVALPTAADSSAVDLFATPDGEELVVVLAAAGGRTEVFRLAADRPAVPAAPVVLDGAPVLTTLADDGALYLLLDRDAVELHVLTPEGTESRALAELPVDDFDLLPNLDLEGLAVDAAGGQAFVVGGAGEDSDVSEPLLLTVDLATGELAEPEYLAERGHAATAVPVDGALLVTGYVADESLAPTAVVWTHALP
ncbi:hypothetical protein [Blastococcus sp. SYSU D00820]